MEKKQTEEIFNIEYTRWERLTLPFRRMRCRFKEKREQACYRRQRAKKGYAACDVWEMRNWFVKTARPMLIELSEKACSHPEDLEFEEWREILHRMADLLLCMDTFDESAVRKKLSIAEDDYSANSSKKISEEMNKAKDEFFTLFDKWFYDLWY